MLARVLLHDVEPPRKVQLAVHRRADRDRAVHAVQQPLAALANVRNGHVVQRADVAGLTALVREERAAIELDEIGAAVRFARDHRRVERMQHGILKIQTFRHTRYPPKTVRNRKTVGSENAVVTATASPASSASLPSAFASG